ncbi:OB-fold protein [Alloiococcus sp. CFN-8]|uniref:OB-fold protein n=1 Tax=Alloiococcus sp. CFN-8 TaxID=3416081 RepID=UPI003CF05B74
MHDFLVNKVYGAIILIGMISPYIFLSNTPLREKLPLFKKHKASSSALGMIIVLCGLMIISGVINGFHSDEYLKDMENHAYLEVSRTEPSCDESGVIEYVCDYCGITDSETIDALGHDMTEISRKEPTQDTEGEIVYQCSLCDKKDVKVIEKLPKPTETSPPEETKEPIETSESIETSEPIETAETPVTEPAPTLPDVTFEDIYKAYKSNELVADDLYKGNRYQVTATINGMSTDGLFNLTGGATLTMQTNVEGTIVFFYAEFEKDQEEALKQVIVGDTITFEGECLSHGMWSECEIVK